MSKKDKWTFFILCFLTCLLMSITLSVMAVKFIYGDKIVEIHKSVKTIEQNL